LGIGTAMGTGAGAAIAVDELKVCPFGVPNRIARPKTASTAVIVTMVLFMFPPRLKVFDYPKKKRNESYPDVARFASTNTISVNTGGGDKLRKLADEA
jgi:hypothetical protein